MKPQSDSVVEEDKVLQLILQNCGQRRKQKRKSSNQSTKKSSLQRKLEISELPCERRFQEASNVNTLVGGGHGGKRANTGRKTGKSTPLTTVDWNKYKITKEKNEINRRRLIKVFTTFL